MNLETLPRAVHPRVERRVHGTAKRVAQHDEEWRLQIPARVLQTPRDFGRISEVGEDFLLHRGKFRGAVEEACVPRFQALQGFVGGD